MASPRGSLADIIGQVVPGEDGDLVLQVTEVTEQEQPRIPGLRESEVSTFVLPVIPQGGQQNIDANATETFDLSRDLDVARVIIDVPTDMDYELELDGATLLTIDDGQGLSLDLQVGDFSGKHHLEISSVSVEVTETSGAAQDVRTWLVVVA